MTTVLTASQQCEMCKVCGTEAGRVGTYYSSPPDPNLNQTAGVIKAIQNAAPYTHRVIQMGEAALTKSLYRYPFLLPLTKSNPQKTNTHLSWYGNFTH